MRIVNKKGKEVKWPTPEEFVTAWTLSKNLPEVALRLNLGLGAVRERAAKYRSKGVKLKYFNEYVKPKELNALITFLEKDEVPFTMVNLIVQFQGLIDKAKESEFTTAVLERSFLKVVDKAA